MRFITVRDLRSRPGAVWRSLREERELAVTLNGRPVALMTAADEATLTDELENIRRVRAERALAAVRQQAARQGLDRMSMAEINREIAAARKENKKRKRKRRCA